MWREKKFFRKTPKTPCIHKSGQISLDQRLLLRFLCRRNTHRMKEKHSPLRQWQRVLPMRGRGGEPVWGRNPARMLREGRR